VLHHLTQQYSILSDIISELRDKSVQQDRLRFRRNLERVGEFSAYELSKMLPAMEVEINTPLGVAETKLLAEQPVLATILRAGLPMHQGMTNVFDRADHAFISAYRKHNPETEDDFTIEIEYLSCPDLNGRVVILCDPMLATGSSIVAAYHTLRTAGMPSAFHVVSAIASVEGIDFVERSIDGVHIWTGAVDEELTAKGYIVPGLGDAGDLAFGNKLQG
jgi:uracil phosphoribosyltransferase